MWGGHDCDVVMIIWGITFRYASYCSNRFKFRACHEVSCTTGVGSLTRAPSGRGRCENVSRVKMKLTGVGLLIATVPERLREGHHVDVTLVGPYFLEAHEPAIDVTANTAPSV